MLRRLRATRRALVTHAWGNADTGQLGLPSPLLSPELETYGLTSRLPQPVPALRRYNLLSAAASASHSAFVRADGTLFLCGHASAGQLGLGDTRPRSEPTEALTAVAAVACGNAHTLALDVHGRVWAFGSNSHGQLGVPSVTAGFSATPVPVAALLDAGHRITRVAAGDDFSAAVCDRGRVYTWGCAAQGRLGHGDPPPHPGLLTFALGDRARAEQTPRLVRGLDGVRIADLFAGKHHVVAVDVEGRAFAWGSARHGQLGTADKKDRFEPVETLTTLRGAAVAKVSPGGMHSLVLTRAGRVYAFGQNEHGCLGLGYEDLSRSVSEPREVQALPWASDVAAGWHVSAAVAKGEVFMWGCGGAGALGNGEVVDHWAPYGIGLRARRVVIGNAGSSVLAFD